MEQRDSFFDQAKGRQRFETGKDFSDFLVWRKEGVASYELATVADDHAMNISEIVRGEDLLLSAQGSAFCLTGLGGPARNSITASCCSMKKEEAFQVGKDLTRLFSPR